MAQCSQLSTWLVTLGTVTYWLFVSSVDRFGPQQPSSSYVHFGDCMSMLLKPCILYILTNVAIFVSWDHRQWHSWPGKEIDHSLEYWSLYLLDYWSSFLSDEQYMEHKYLYNFAHFKRFVYGHIYTDHLPSISSHFDWKAIIFYGVSFRTITNKN